jgi:hypothetical protein
MEHKIKFVYGNLHKLLENGKSLRSNPELKNNHEWTFFFGLEKGSSGTIKDYVNKIDVVLDPTFGDIPITLRAAPF